MWSLEARTRAQGKVQAKPVLTGAPGWGRGTCFGYGFWREVSNLAERKKHKETPAGTVRKYNQLVLHGLIDLMCISHGDGFSRFHCPGWAKLFEGGQCGGERFSNSKKVLQIFVLAFLLDSLERTS